MLGDTMKLAFNPGLSKTIWGALVAAFGYLSKPDVLAMLPEKWASVVTVIGGIILAIGARDAIAKNGAAATAAQAREANTGKKPGE